MFGALGLGRKPETFQLRLGYTVTKEDAARFEAARDNPLPPTPGAPTAHNTPADGETPLSPGRVMTSPSRLTHRVRSPYPTACPTQSLSPSPTVTLSLSPLNRVAAAVWLQGDEPTIAKLAMEWSGAEPMDTVMDRLEDIKDEAVHSYSEVRAAPL
jgi:hypothetical protein